MIIYLYKKTHNKTGLNYLGKTIQDPFTYKGSGKRWGNHINKHGYDVTTEILRECQTNEEVKEWGLYYSNLWNVVKDRTWANLKEENGDGGGICGEGNGMFGRTHSDELKANQAIIASTRFKGKSYEELYGKEKAAQLKQDRSTKLKQHIASTPDNRIGSNNPNAKRYEFISPNNEVFKVEGALKVFCVQQGLDCGAMIKVLKNHREDYKGWKARYF
jgi:hypothetical protein